MGFQTHRYFFKSRNHHPVISTNMKWREEKSLYAMHHEQFIAHKIPHAYNTGPPTQVRNDMQGFAIYPYFCPMQLCLNSLDDLKTAAQSIINFAGDEKIFLFYGQMGAGKTTLINALCRELGVTENTSSPTFAIVNEYRSSKGNIFHFDFYRLKNQTEALDIGFEEYVDSGNYCFIEWPEKIPDLLPLNHLRISIAVTGEGAREITVDKI